MASISVTLGPGFAAIGRLGPINNAEAVVTGFQASVALGIYDSYALRAPAARGYVVSATTTDIVIDRSVDLLDCVCDPHKLTIVMPDGTLQSRYLLANAGTTLFGTTGITFVDTDIYPNFEPQPDSFSVAIDLAPAVSVAVTLNVDGSVQLHYDVTPLGLGIGAHTAVVIAVSATWGNSAPISLPFTIGAGSTSTLTVEVPFTTPPAAGARWILNDGFEVGDGHVISGTVGAVTLDSSVDLDLCGRYTLTVFAPDGTGVEAQDTVTDAGTQSSVTLEANLGTAPSPGWIWTLRDAPEGFEDASAVVTTGVQAIGMLGGVGVDLPMPNEPVMVPAFGIGLVSSLGSVIVTVAPDSVSVTGRVATGSVGAISFREDQLPAASGVNATSALGSVSVSAGTSPDVGVTGLGATGSVGTAAIIVHMSVAVTGLSADGQVDAVGISTQGSVPVFGVSADGVLGNVAVALAPNIPVSGVEAITAVGSVSVSLDTLAAVGGVHSVSALGVLSMTADVSVVIVAGLESTGLLGAAAFGQLQDGEPVGVEAIGMLGSVIVHASNERHRVLHVARVRPPRVLRVADLLDIREG